MFTVLNYSISRDVIASVHRTGCKDIERDASAHAAIPYAGFETLAEALADFIDGEMVEMGYSVEDVHVLPCAIEADRASRRSPTTTERNA